MVGLNLSIVQRSSTWQGCHIRLTVEKGSDRWMQYEWHNQIPIGSPSHRDPIIMRVLVVPVIMHHTRSAIYHDHNHHNHITAIPQYSYTVPSPMLSFRQEMPTRKPLSQARAQYHNQTPTPSAMPNSKPRNHAPPTLTSSPMFLHKPPKNPVVPTCPEPDRSLSPDPPHSPPAQPPRRTSSAGSHQRSFRRPETFVPPER